MVVVNDGKNRVRDLINADINSGEHGTDNTTPTAGDSGLGAGVAATNATPTQTIGNKIINSSHVLLSTVGNGITFKEFVIYINGGNTPLIRVVYPNFDKTSSEELHTTTVVRVD